MSTVMVDGVSSHARGTRSRFYVGLALLIAAITLTGFAPSLYASLFQGLARPWFIHLHAAVYVGWLLLLIVQSVIAAQGRIALHRRVGNFGIAYGCLVFVLGVIVTFAATVVHIAAGEWTTERGGRFLALSLGDMVLFAGFFGSATAYRRRPEIHKRLILLASVALMFAGAGRLWFMGEPTNVPLLLAVWYSPVALGVVYDVVTTRRVHPVYWIGAAVMGVWLFRVPVGQTDMWQSISEKLLAAFA